MGNFRIVHDVSNIKKWFELFNTNDYGSAIVICGTELDGAMFVVTKRITDTAFVKEIYNTGGYGCYKAQGSGADGKLVLSVGREGAWYTIDIIVMGAAK